MTRHLLTAAVAVVLASIPAAPVFAQRTAPDVLDARVRELFVRRCAECHGRDEDQAPVLDATTNLAALRNDPDFVARGDPARSKLFQLISLPAGDRKRMPKSGAADPRPPLLAEEQALLREWITGAAEAERPFLAEAEVMKLILGDLAGAPTAARPWLRYLSLHNLHNQPPTLIGARDLDQHRAALSKLINSLSWRPAIKRPEPIDGATRVVFRLDLRDYGWDAAMWRLVAQHNPYGFVNAELDSQLAAASGTRDLLWLRADWFIFAAAQPPLYERLLFPEKTVPRLLADPDHAEQHLEAYLGVKPLENLRAAAGRGSVSAEDFLFGRTNAAATAEAPVVRAGFLKSGVSNYANRLIERHALPGGRAYWKSYDFARSEPGGPGNLVSHPLGPVGSSLSQQDRFAFRHDGGELIFHLPNGLQGYLLTTAAGKLLARAPDAIVQDLSRVDRQILNGISCIKCHSDGMKEPPNGLRDDIRAGALRTLAGRTTAEEVRALDNLYLGEADLARYLGADRARFRLALQQAGADQLAEEPISYAYGVFLKSITEEVMASELDFDRRRFARTLTETLAIVPDEGIRSLSVALASGFSREQFIPRLDAIATQVFRRQMRPFAPLIFEEFNRGGTGATGTAPPAVRAAFPAPSVHLATKDKPFVNGLGMKFVPVAGTDVLFSVWETRVADFAAFVQATGHKAEEGMFSLDSDGWKQRGDTWRNPGFKQSEHDPVVGVSWEDAQAFCAWLTQRERAAGRLRVDQSYRLPTDREWSRAVGLPAANDATPEKNKDIYPWGGTFPPTSVAGNYAGPESKIGKEPADWTFIARFGDGKLTDGFARTSPVGSFAANRFGLHDLGGNAWEWCEDWYRKEMNSVEVRKELPFLDDDGGGSARRVLRGGSWNYDHPATLLSSFRDYVTPTYRNDNIGFRCALVAGAAAP